MTSRLVQWLSRWQALAKFSLQTDKNFEFLTDTLFRFLTFDGAKIPMVIENHPVFGSFFFSF